MSANEQERIEKVLQDYIDAVWNHDTVLMTRVFHRQAILSSHFENEFSIVPAVEAIVGYMNSIPPIAETSPKFEGRVISIEHAGTAASATITENHLEGLNFTTFFQLHKIDESWIITSKATYGEPE